MRSLELLSVVAPMHNEEETVDAFYERVRTALQEVGPWQLVIVDDGSTDGTGAALDRLAETDPRVAIIHLSRSFGHQAALTAGLEHAHGNAVAMIDGDLQDPPELIADMVERWREGSDVVYAVRSQRDGETRMKLATARWFYKLFARVGQVKLEQNSGDFRLLDRRALDALLSHARAQPLPARDDRVDRLHADRDPLRARRALRRRDEVHACARCCASRSTRSRRSRGCRSRPRRCSASSSRRSRSSGCRW